MELDRMNHLFYQQETVTRKLMKLYDNQIYLDQVELVLLSLHQNKDKKTIKDWNTTTRLQQKRIEIPIRIMTNQS